MNAAGFPIAPLLPRICASLVRHPRLVLQAPPGAGKTTQVPPALLDAGWLSNQRVVMLEPRRIAARAAAAFMAAQRGEAVGHTIGYRIRFESRASDATRILVVTEGILTRMLQDDPELAGVGAIIFDEFHERHLQGDLGAALALDVQASLRPELRLLVMSATLDGDRVAQWLDAPVFRSEGRAFPVRLGYPPARRGESGSAHACRAVQQALGDTDGDVLVFLPGRREIAEVQGMLAGLLSSPPPSGTGSEDPPHAAMPVSKPVRPPSAPPATGAADHAFEVLPLYGELPLAAQQAALAPPDAGVRRVILATNVAESSVTVPGVRAVVDSGLAREPRFDPNSGFARLATVSISQASADQRAGRAGRIAPGIGYRLWPESRRLDPSRTPEITQTDLSGLALELAAWGIRGDPAAALAWLDPPPAGALGAARDLLQRLGALDRDLAITTRGRRMLELGANPRLAAAAARAPAALRALAADVLAVLETRSPLRARFNDDVRARLAALQRCRDGGVRAVRFADPGILHAIEDAARGWRRRLGARHGATGTPGPLTVGNLLLHAFPDRAARQDPRDPRRYVLANGRGARLHDDSALFGEPWLIVIEARFDARDSLILAAAPFDATLLESEYPDRIATVRRVRESDRGTVEAFEERRFDALVLSRRAVAVTADDTLPALIGTIRAHGLAALPWSDAAQQLRSRIAWLRRCSPDAGLPDVSDATLLDSLEYWLAPALAGKRNLAALSAAEVADALAGLLDWRQRRLLDQDAPATITAPSGRSHRLDYSAALDAGPDAASPVLAVKLQELFGLGDTPRIAGGRVPLTLHLLSPAGRPIQVTQDLRGFWNHTYAEVKKELKGRYPKHPWPDDPWSAIPTHRTKRRS